MQSEAKSVLKNAWK